MRLSLSKLLFIFYILIILASCARRGTPTGGAKDSIPPILLKALPINLFP